MIEKLLGMFEGGESETRVELVQVGEAGELPTLELRLQREAGELGWTTQRRIRLAPGQWGELRDALNMADLDVRQARHVAPAASSVERPALRLIG